MVVGFYAVHAAVVFYTLIVLRQLLSAELLSPGWLSLRLLSWMSAAAATGAAALMWLNLRGSAPRWRKRLHDASPSAPSPWG